MPFQHFEGRRGTSRYGAHGTSRNVDVFRFEPLTPQMPPKTHELGPFACVRASFLDIGGISVCSLCLWGFLACFTMICCFRAASTVFATFSGQFSVFSPGHMELDTDADEPLALRRSGGSFCLDVDKVDTAPPQVFHMDTDGPCFVRLSF